MRNCTCVVGIEKRKSNITVAKQWIEREGSEGHNAIIHIEHEMALPLSEAKRIAETKCNPKHTDPVASAKGARPNNFFKFFTMWLLLMNLSLNAQKPLTGKVILYNNEKKEPIEGAKIYWLESKNTIVFTDSLGRFSIPKLGDSLQVSMIGFYSDTLIIKKLNPIEIGLVPLEGSEVIIQDRKKATYINTKNPFLTETMTEKEFTKAACCNLSESFETNASVDANYTDAVTGTKQIQMLGLSSIYSMISVENMPNIRGLSATHGLSFYPSAWVESIQITKGSGSVVNGFESMTGQINIELKKPSQCSSSNDFEDDTPKNFMNVYLNQMLRTEWNYTRRYKFNNQWDGMSLAHASMMPLKVDMNHDHFLDNPIGYQLGYIQRANFHYDRWEGMISARGMYDVKQSGQTHFNPQNHVEDIYFGTVNRNQRFELIAKIGYLFPEKEYKSIGNQISISNHQMHFDYGRNHFDGLQNTIYYNGIYQTQILDSRHLIKTGISFMGDIYQNQWNTLNLSRNEWVPGTFAEYTWKPNPSFNSILGVRTDYHSKFGLWFTPRLHLRYEITEKTIVRASGGKGYRTSAFFSDHWSSFINSRKVILPDTTSSWLGFKPEIAWNYGISLQQNFKFFNENSSLIFDFFRTDFVNQIIVDRDANSLLLKFYNLSGQSFANAFQFSYEGEVTEGLEIRLAYKFYDVRQTIDGKLREFPLISRHRGFFNMNWELNKEFSLDFTAQYHGKKRIPDTNQSPLEFQQKPNSRPFWLMMSQINYRWKKWEFYLGVENMNNFRQFTPIVNSKEPFRDYFDASMVWGPIYGIMSYFGLRVEW